MKAGEQANERINMGLPLEKELEKTKTA